MTDERRALLFMLAFAALWTLVETLAAPLLNKYSAYQVVWTRYAVHLVFMVLVWGWREPATLWRTRRPVYQIARSLLMLGMPACWIIGLQMGIDARALMSVFWLSPLFIVALAHLFLDERAPAWVWVASAVVGLGAALAYGLSRLPAVEWLVFPLGMALCFSGYVVMTRPLRRENLRANLFYTALGVFVALTPAMSPLWITPSAHDLAILVAVGLFGFVVLLALDRMAAAAPVSGTAPVAATQIAFGAALGFGLGHHVPTYRELVGLLLIMAVALFCWMRGSGADQRLVQGRAA